VKDIIGSKYSRLFFAGLALIILCAWFSTGFNQADEHFQVLEFCSYKMGIMPAAQLPWEFAQRVRATLLPGMAYVLVRVLNWLHIYNPFILTFILRLFVGIWSWFITCKLCLLLLSKFKGPKGEKLFILLSLFLWFVPYLAVRFTPENLSGIALLSGVYIILKMDEKKTYSWGGYIISGLLFGVSFFIRFQILFALAGLAAWLLFINKTKWKYIFTIGISMAFAIALNVVIDYWFYGQWTFTPFNYFDANITRHMAVQFGTNPWWFYFSEFFMKGVPPFSLILLVVFFIGMFKNLRDPFAWIIIPFIALHFFTPHKELRFLFPVAFIFVYLTALGFDYLLSKSYYLKMHRYVITILWCISIPTLLFRILAPANSAVCYCEYLYEHAFAKGTPLFAFHNDVDYSMYGSRASFYKNQDINTVYIDSLSQINKFLETSQPQTALFLDKHIRNGEFFNGIKGYKTEMVYSYLPAWIGKINFNNWEERTEIWRIYRFSKLN